MHYWKYIPNCTRKCQNCRWIRKFSPIMIKLYSTSTALVLSSQIVWGIFDVNLLINSILWLLESPSWALQWRWSITWRSLDSCLIICSYKFVTIKHQIPDHDIPGQLQFGPEKFYNFVDSCTLREQWAVSTLKSNYRTKKFPAFLALVMILNWSPWSRSFTLSDNEDLIIQEFALHGRVDECVAGWLNNCPNQQTFRSLLQLT